MVAKSKDIHHARDLQAPSLCKMQLHSSANIGEIAKRVCHGMKETNRISKMLKILHSLQEKIHTFKANNNPLRHYE